MTLTPGTAAVVIGVVLLAGAVTGIAGFGFAVVGTMALATRLGPRAAVAFMIVPILATNVSLARELDSEELRACGRRFAPLIAATVVGTLVGMVALGQLPEGPLTRALGVLTLGFVATQQEAVTLPGAGGIRDRCFVESPAAMVGVGGGSGLLFGATNVGVQLVAYLRSCGLRHGLFVGVVGLVFLGVNGLRVGAAVALGLYPDAATAGLSAVAALPAVAGVVVGRRLRPRIPKAWQRRGVLTLLTVVGLRLLGLV